MVTDMVTSINAEKALDGPQGCGPVVDRECTWHEQGPGLFPRPTATHTLIRQYTRTRVPSTHMVAHNHL